MSDRPLYLDISALSPEEFDLYTSTHADLSGASEEWDRPVDVMEARGWIRGRYGMDAVMVDKILKYFSTSSVGRTEILSAGQFFGVMRLVLHAQAGREPVRALVFVQAKVSGGNNSPSSSMLNRRPSASASRANHVPPPKPSLPPPPSRQAEPSSDYGRNSNRSSTYPSPQPHTPQTADSRDHAAPNSNTNPFRRASMGASSAAFVSGSALETDSQPEGDDYPLPAPPLHPNSRLSFSNPASLTGRSEDAQSESSSHHRLGSISRNPFNLQTIATSTTMPALPPRFKIPPSLPPRLSDASTKMLTPSLPPRPAKSVSSKTFPTTLIAATPTPIATSALIKESLRAAKEGKAYKDNEALLEKTLSMEVIRRSGSRDSTSGSDTFAPPPLIIGVRQGPPASRIIGGMPNGSPTKQLRRAAPSPPPSLGVPYSGRPPVDRRVTLGASSQPLAPSRSAGLALEDDSSGADDVSVSRSVGSYPFNGRAYPTAAAGVAVDGDKTPVSRLGRSKSLHQQRTPPPAMAMETEIISPAPIQPPPRRRPESIVTLESLAAKSSNARPHDPQTSSANYGTLGTASGHEPFSNLYESVKKRAEGLQPTVRRLTDKAEGRVVPGGFNRRRGRQSETRGLFSDDPNDDVVDGDDYDSGVDPDEPDWSEWDRTGRPPAYEGVNRDRGRDPFSPADEDLNSDGYRRL